jgi:heme-degrading monooxygenase HmoA
LKEEHMWSRVTKIKVDPSKISEEKRIIEESAVPAAKEKKGFRGVVWLSEPSTGKGIVISFWETKEDLLANEESGFFQEQEAKFSSVLTEPALKEHYEVISESALAQIT